MAPAKTRQPEPETTEEEEMTASPRYLLFAEWLRDEKGLDCDPLTLEIAQKNYGAFQRSDVNRENNIRLAQEREQAIADRQAAREKAAAEREEKRKAAEEAKAKKAAEKAAEPKASPATTTAKKAAAAKKAAPAAPAKTVGKPRAARAKGAASPF